MSLTYAQYQSLMATMLAVSSPTETNFVAVLPSMIAYAENRIYQDLDLVKNLYDYSRAVTPGTRAVTVPDSGGPNNIPIFIAHSASIITPAGASVATGKRNPLQRASMEFINFVYPSASVQGVPLFYGISDDAVQLAPTPDAAYLISMSGIIRPLPLSAANTTTWLTLNVESLFVAASMVFGAGFQKNFGAMADDPKMAQSWEAQYQELLKSASVDESRRKAAAEGWQALWPTPLALQPRT